MNNRMRDRVFTPIIESTAQEILDQKKSPMSTRITIQPIPKQRLTENITNHWQHLASGSISRPDVREWLGMIMQPNMGGKAWEEMEPIPTGQHPSTQLVAEKKVDPNLAKSAHQYLEK